MWNRWLQGIEAIIEPQQRVLPERSDGRLLGFCQNCGTWLLRPCLAILDCPAFAPLHDRLRIDAELRLSVASEAGDPWIAALTACVVVAIL